MSDAETFSQSGMVPTDTFNTGSGNDTWTYSYDKADRLTGAANATNTFSYGFGTQDASCGSGANMNPNAGRNGNRTSQTIDGVTTTYCYDYADRLVSSSDPSANGAQYDSHGNTTQIGTGSAPLRLTYNSLDQNNALVSYDGSGNGSGMYYYRDVTGRIVYREHDNIANSVWTLDTAQYYGFTGPGDSPDFVRDGNWNITDKYLQLPGGVMVDIKPQQSGNTQKQYTLPSIEGRTLLTVDAAGANTSTGSGPLNSFAYDPFGNAIGSLPSNATNGSYGFGGTLQKITETTVALAPIQMGARVYFPTLGRFASVDPVDGGTPNRYVYVVDPINSSDYSGQFGFELALAAVFAPEAILAAVVITIVAVVVVAAVIATYAVVSHVVSDVKARASSQAEPRANTNSGPRCKSYTPAPGRPTVEAKTARVAKLKPVIGLGVGLIQSSLAMGIKPGGIINPYLTDPLYTGWQKYAIGTGINKYDFHSLTKSTVGMRALRRRERRRGTSI